MARAFAWRKFGWLLMAACTLLLAGAISSSAQAWDELDALNATATQLGAEQKWDEAISVGERAVDVAAGRANTERGRLGAALHDLGFYYRRAGRLSQAEDRYRRALAIRERLSPDAQDTAITLNNLALVLSDRARHAEAEQLFRRSLVIREKHDDISGVAVVLNNLGLLYLAQRRFADAEPLFIRSLAIRKQIKGPNSEEVATAENNLALLYQGQGQFALAEQSYKRAAAVREQTLGPAHPLLGTTLGGLAVLYRVQGRNDEAEPLFVRSLEILQTALPSNHPDIGTASNNFGIFEASRGRLVEAKALYRQALSIRKKTGNTPGQATTMINLAAVLAVERQYPESEALLRQALAFVEKDFGLKSLRSSVILNSLAGLYLEQARRSHAEELFGQALSIREEALGPNHPDLVQSLGNLGALHYLNRDWTEAVSYLRRATRVMMSRSRRGGSSSATDVSDTEQDDLAQRGRLFGLFVQASYRLTVVQDINHAKLRDESFHAGQWAVESAAAYSLAQASAREAQSDLILAATLRERQDLVREWQWKDAYLVRSFSQRPQSRDRALEQEYRARLNVIENRIGEIDGSLSRDLLSYGALSQPMPLNTREVQTALTDDEALIAVLSTEGIRSISGETFVWVVTKTDTRWVRVDIGRTALEEQVQTLRCGLDAEEWEGIARPARCGRLLGMQGKPRLEDPLPFNLGIAHELYRALFGQVEDLISDKHLLIVPSGPLTSLPFQVLVTSEPSTALPKSFAGYRGVSWLGRRQPLTVLPSVASLQALRRFAKASPGHRAYRGYGNPVLLGDGSCRLGIMPETCAPMTMRERVAVRSVSMDRIYRKGAGQEAVLAEVRSLCPLPDTAFELRCVAKSLGVPESEVRLGEAASESDIKQLSASGELANYRVVHFATHGLLAGDTELMMRRQGEPALVMTPPTAPKDAEDDGLLTASEVALLKLNADWVILSACNTAAGDKLGAEALSGLARAFFYAGARTLLVSHWPVYSDAALQLLERTFAEMRQDDTIGRSEAFRRAMIALIDDPAQADNPHPAIWAPFSIVGEGSSTETR
jgi:CHAT domain-containing protein/tetratricopeptide (TPR) repeat protein